MSSPEQKLYSIVSESLAGGDYPQAISTCRELNVRFPEYFDGWRIAGEIHLSLKKPEAALFSTERALALRPNDPAVLLQRLDSLLSTDRVADARQLLQKISLLDPQNAAFHDQTGRLMASLDMHEESLRQYQVAVGLQPDNAASHFNVATALRFLGQTEDAIDSLDRCLALEELDFEAQAMRSSLRAQSAESNHVDELRNVLANSRLPAHGQVSICFALAKEFDDLDDTAQSFEFLQRGAKQRRKSMDYRVETDLDIIAGIRRVYDAVFFASGGSGDESLEPIFILGLPRTGTTLVERILGSHSAVHSAGELDNFGRVTMAQLAATSTVSGLSREDVIEKCSELDFAALGRAYIDSTRPMTGQTPHFIDKLPFNYLYVGLIRRALPNAKIINLQRHPMATCYAIYKQLFRDPYPFSYDLDDLGRYFIAYSGLMDHWNRVLPGVVHTMAYENLVDDTETQARALLEFCGLDWEEQCLTFYENRQAVTTASAAQVRKPIYRSSLERWRDYAEGLASLDARLSDAGIDTS